MTAKSLTFKLVASLTAACLGLVNLVKPAWAVPAEGHKILVAGPSPDSPAIARQITDRGGNVVDVTVAVVLALGVTHPYYAALGGGGFALVRIGEKTAALDFRETAFRAANADLYTALDDKATTDGGLAVGVPGVVAGLHALHAKFGKLAWREVLAPSRRLAKDGFLVSGDWARITTDNQKRFNKSGAKFFPPLKPGERLRQPQLEKALALIEKQGERGFYAGALANDLVNSVNASGGKLTLQDLADYRVRWLKPLVTKFADRDVILMPPPSSGGVVIASALSLIERIKLPDKAALSVDEYHGLIEVMKLSFRGRSLLGDPDFSLSRAGVSPVDQLLNENYLKSLAKRFRWGGNIQPEPLAAIDFEKEQTTHVSVLDSVGNAVALTLTLNGEYGSGVVSERFGIALNNEMDDFNTHPGKPNMFGLIQGEANNVRAGARPLSSMSPTIVTRNGQTEIVLGAPGGPRIISSVLQVLYRLLVTPIDVDTAVQSPRVHHQFLPNVVRFDQMRFSPETITALEKRGHKLEAAKSMGKVYVVRRKENGLLEAAADARGEGAAGGY